MEITHVCSLGTLCQSSQILKNNNLKTCSYPFDWIFSDCDMIIDCLENNFNKFLDKNYYISIKDNDHKCGHILYHPQMFNHFNPLNNNNDYEYYVRCVNRFKQLLQYEEHKLFIMIFVDMDIINEDIKNYIINFNNEFSKYTKNYTLLVILHIRNKENNFYEFTHHDNIDFLELHTLSCSNGANFINKIDNDYVNDIIKQTYNFKRNT